MNGMTISYVTLDGSTRAGTVESLPSLTRDRKRLKVRFHAASPIALKADGAITALFCGERGWAQFGEGDKRVWKKLVRAKGSKGSVQWVEA